MFCIGILSPVVMIIRAFIQIARQIVRTICEWVSSVISVVKTIVEEVCKWLPWPLNRLCDLVTTVITVLETVWNWVCHDVIETIFDWIEVVFEYIVYILKWICWVIDWITRGPDLLLCHLGIRPPKFLGVCVKILADAAGNPVISVPDAQAMLKDAGAIFERCNVRLLVCSIEIVIKPEFLTSTTCEFSGMFKRFFSWFSSNTCGCCSTVTVYFVQDMIGAGGCAYPGTDFVIIPANADGTVIVQEIGHLCDLWAHSSDPNNVMTDQGGGTHDQITEGQCCMIRTSRFVHFARPCGLFRLSKAAFEERLKHSVGEPFKRKERGTGRKSRP